MALEIRLMRIWSSLSGSASTEGSGSREHNPSVVVLDVQMPGPTGLELARAIKRDPMLSRTFVILLTSRAQASDVGAGPDCGADEYLTKPFSPRELLALVESATEA